MSGGNQEQTNHTSYFSEGDSILENLRALREQIIIAWRERAVVLSTEEQAALKAEIEKTCEFLTDLTHPGKADRRT